ncbi:MAG: Hsp70 family protein [Planctomycetota bacterium]
MRDGRVQPQQSAEPATAIVGIDPGARYLRLAVAQDEGDAPIYHSWRSRRLPFLSGPVTESADAGTPLWQITSLKSLLDFEQRVPVPPDEMNSLDCLAEVLRAASGPLQEAAGEEGARGVVAVPPCFSQRQRAAFRTAAAKAGFSLVRLVDDTRAVLLACREDVKGAETVLVYSWDASAFSACVYRAAGDAYRSVGQDGERHLGGDDLDAVICAALFAALTERAGDAGENAERDFHYRMAVEAEEAKRLLLADQTASVAVSDLLGSACPPPLRRESITLAPELCRSDLEAMMEKTMACVQAALEDADCKSPDVIVLSGGMANVAAVGTALSERLGAPLHSARPQNVAVGAALYGDMLPESEWAKGQRAPGQQPEEGPAARWADHFLPFLNRAQQQESQGRPEEAVRTFEQLFQELHKFSSALYRRVATAYESAGRLNDAYELLLTVHKRDPSNRLVAADLARVCDKWSDEEYSRRMFDAVLKHASQGAAALQALPHGASEHAPLLAHLLWLKGRALYKRGRLPEARDAMERCVGLDARQDQYQEDLTTIHRELGRTPILRAAWGKKLPGRNAPCPCGSGRKYKNCCGRKA